jgi:26S proteasome regulatory subunit N7
MFILLFTEMCSQIYFRLIDEGGDWDRRNRLKVYNGLYLVSIRQFKRGGELLLDALSTFTATELISYNDFVALTVIVNSLTLTRVDLKKRVSSPFITRHSLRLLTATSQLINSPEVIQALPDLPILGDLVKNLYNCRYDKFFVALGNIYSPLLLRQC